MSFQRHEYPSGFDVMTTPGYMEVRQEIRQDQNVQCPRCMLVDQPAWLLSSSGYVYWSLTNLASKPQEVVFTSKIANRLISWRTTAGDQIYGPRTIDLLPRATPCLLSSGFEVRGWGAEQIETKVAKTALRTHKPIVLVSTIHLVEPDLSRQAETTKNGSGGVQPMETTTDDLTILHLSDIHLREESQVQPYKTHLVSDLKRELGVSRLDYVVISGDVADQAKPEEYSAARKLVSGILSEFRLTNDRVIVVPGNHDVDWEQSMQAYCRMVAADRITPSDVRDQTFIKIDDGRGLMCDSALYQKRFATFDTEFFSHFGHGKPYPPLPTDQGIVYAFPSDKILFLGLNSACRTDHHYKNRSGINEESVANALSELEAIATDESWIKIAVWHHPIEEPGGGMKTGFLDHLNVQGFHIGMHGHIHRAKESDYKYDDARHIHIIGAGTFGAPSTQQVPGIPLQYHLIKIDRARSTATVNTRKKETPDGTWKADSRWGSSNSPQPQFEISLRRKRHD